MAYVGNELRGYGNLVLIKHADGWITAYAHQSTMLLVKKGDTGHARPGRSRKVGATGAVGEPQLHFELRRGTRAGRSDASYLPPAAAAAMPAQVIEATPSFLPSRPARSWMNCQATRPERAPRVIDHSLASALQLLRRRSSRP